MGSAFSLSKESKIAMFCEGFEEALRTNTLAWNTYTAYTTQLSKDFTSTQKVDHFAKNFFFQPIEDIATGAFAKESIPHMVDMAATRLSKHQMEEMRDLIVAHSNELATRINPKEIPTDTEKNFTRWMVTNQNKLSGISLFCLTPITTIAPRQLALLRGVNQVIQFRSTPAKIDPVKSALLFPNAIILTN